MRGTQNTRCFNGIYRKAPDENCWWLTLMSETQKIARVILCACLPSAAEDSCRIFSFLLSSHRFQDLNFPRNACDGLLIFLLKMTKTQREKAFAEALKEYRDMVRVQYIWTHFSLNDFMFRNDLFCTATERLCKGCPFNWCFPCSTQLNWREKKLGDFKI